MKRVMFACFLATILLTSFAGAAACNLNATLFNQDPYPAIPGDYVKLVFQVTGVDNPECSNIYFQLLPQYPISFDPNTSSEVMIKGGGFVTDYSSYLQVPFKVRVDENAVEGDNEIKAVFSGYKGTEKTLSIEQKFNLNVEDTRVDFDVFVKDYNYDTNAITLQVLNTGNSDIEALTVEIPTNQAVKIKGANKNVIGSLDSNEYTTTDFQILPDGEIKFNVLLAYNDKNDIRRVVSKEVVFNSDLFLESSQKKGISIYLYVIMATLLLVAYLVYRRYRKHNLRFHKK
jgi:hypothetical protein